MQFFTDPLGEASTCSPMANKSGVVTLVPDSMAAAAPDSEMADFLAQVTHIRSLADIAAMSGAEHIARLHRPGAKYFNMYPFEVLGLTHRSSAEEVRGAYRKLSVKVHPDKNPGNERAQAAFEVVKAAAERLEESDRMAFCVRICQAAEEAVEKKVAKEKKRLRKEGQDEDVPEDDPDRLASSIKVMICRMFAEFEQRKKQLQKQDAEAKQKARDEMAEREFMDALKQREQKMWEKSRQKRVNGWRAWESSGGGSKPKIPKLKEERRSDGSAHWDGRGDDYKKDWR